MEKVNKKAEIAFEILKFALIGALCSSVVSCNNQKQEEQSRLESLSESQEEEFTTKIFEPYTHVYYKRYDLLKRDGFSTRIYSQDVSGGQVEVPEGYEILEIENFDEEVSRGSQTRGFDVWFINTETVEVEPVYNQTLEVFDYSEPGKVIQLEEDQAKTLQKTKED